MRHARFIFVIIILLPASPHLLSAQDVVNPDQVMENANTPLRASGTFEVQLNPQPPDDYADGELLGRITIDKTYAGDLEATALGQMLTAMTERDGSAGYVAIERVTGILDGRSGSFILQHNGIMNRGAQQLLVQIVPDSGTGELTGVTGTMTIHIDEGAHRYEMEYALPGDVNE